MSPCGNFESLHAAIQAGADSVYFGIGNLNMRSLGAKNFNISDLKKIKKITKENKVKAYLTLNTVIYDKELKQAYKICDKAKQNKIDAVIASDMAIIQYCKKIKQPVHISTQCNITNIEEVKFYSKYAKAIVLARELNLKQITKINKQIKEQNLKVKTEAFVHGALCVAISGKCYMSLATYNTSANRGKCLQPCRRQYQVTDIETQKQLNIKNKFVMSPSDLCTIRILPKLIKAGIQIFKIEGRARSPEYVYTVTKVYKQAIQTKNPTKQQVEQWEKELGKVYNRGFWHNGYYMGEKVNEWSQSYGSKAKEKKILLGKVINYYKKAKIAHIKIESNQLKVNDTILITGPTTGIIKTKVKQMHHNKQSIKQAKKPSDITIKTNLVRKNDKVYKLIKR